MSEDNNSTSLNWEDIQLILQVFLPAMIENLLRRGMLDRDRLSDLAYVHSVIKQNSEIILDSYSVTRIDDEFIESAQEALAQGRKLAALVLIATSIEHIINLFYRQVLETKLGDDVITEVIRNSIHAKLGWISSLITTRQIPPQLVIRIKSLMDLRNTIVHYKAEPAHIDDDKRGSYNFINYQINNIDFVELFALPSELETELDKIIEEMIPERKIAREAASVLLSSENNST